MHSTELEKSIRDNDSSHVQLKYSTSEMIDFFQYNFLFILFLRILKNLQNKST